MAVSLFGSYGEKVSKTDLSPGTATLAYTSNDRCRFGVILVSVQPRIFALLVLTQTAMEVVIVRKTVIVRLARSKNDMASQFPNVIPVATVELPSELEGVYLGT